MKAFLAANAFFALMSVCVGLQLFIVFYLARIFGFTDETSRYFFGVGSLLSLATTGFIFRAALRRIERR